MNLLVITGNLTKDAETRFTSDGKAVCGFDVANNQGFGDKQHTEYYKCSLWGKRAESLGQYLTKGKQVTIYGEHRTDKREYNGKTYFDNKLFVNDVVLTSASDGQSNTQNQKQNHDPSARQPNPQGHPQAEGFDDDIPF